jgi:hypothetical protein
VQDKSEQYEDEQYQRDQFGQQLQEQQWQEYQQQHYFDDQQDRANSDVVLTGTEGLFDFNWQALAPTTPAVAGAATAEPVHIGNNSSSYVDARGAVAVVADEGERRRAQQELAIQK